MLRGRFVLGFSPQKSIFGFWIYILFFFTYILGVWAYILGCLDLYFRCLDLYFGFLDLYFGCPDGRTGGRARLPVGRRAGGRADGRTVTYASFLSKTNFGGNNFEDLS